MNNKFGIVNILLIMFGLTVCILVLTSKDESIKDKADDLLDTMAGAMIGIVMNEYRHMSNDKNGNNKLKK